MTFIKFYMMFINITMCILAIIVLIDIKLLMKQENKIIKLILRFPNSISLINKIVEKDARIVTTYNINGVSDGIYCRASKNLYEIEHVHKIKMQPIVLKDYVLHSKWFGRRYEVHLTEKEQIIYVTLSSSIYSEIDNVEIDLTAEDYKIMQYAKLMELV